MFTFIMTRFMLVKETLFLHKRRYFEENFLKVNGVQTTLTL